MANLIETSGYEPGIYQLERTDPVVGGQGGTSNIQAQQLANRTAWLRQRLEALESDLADTLATHRQEDDPHPQYLNPARGHRSVIADLPRNRNQRPSFEDHRQRR